ncbi:hypothetical protein AX769_13425 [Frondihabitans sp. PAMC 28766]|uniref:DUF4191 domain-containing protein n=1 Tax=Frondihabitans sp. PAMC 28766 TaxID=1795630 RepID=UPI00078E9386|nr:DUF4191 domain-containing protein [Frondihabitans sp. PAMC 28766]AMM20952.1 hypothetical protein AX769_13425 [Frondihabitans sp. PAMC 28766]
MARNTPAESSSSTPAKEPGRLKQMWQVFNMTRRSDSTAIWWMIAAFAVPVIIGLALAFTIGRSTIINMVLYIIVGVMAGVLLFMVVLGRLAERAAYSQIEGQPGAVGAVFKSGLRRQWRASEMPVAVNGRSQAAVYRAVGRPGVVLVTEGTRGATSKIVEEEKRKVARITPGVAITVLSVGPDADSIPLHKLASRMNRVKNKNMIGRNEVLAVSNRLDSLGQNKLPIPKGVDPMRVRSGRPR